MAAKSTCSNSADAEPQITAFTALAGSQTYELILGALLCPDSVLASVYLANPPSAAVCALSSLKALRQCLLDGSGQDMHRPVYDISALQALPLLEELRLSGRSYVGVPASSQLTQLHAVYSEVSFTEGAQQNVGIKDLLLLNADVSGIHKDGGCTTLQAVNVAECTVSGTVAWVPHEMHQDIDFGVGYQHAVAFIPAALSGLSQLTTLKMAISSESVDGYDIGWVYCLQTLRQLTLEMDDAFSVDDGLTQLTGPTKLRLSCMVESGPDLTWAGNYRIGWTGLQSLQQLELDGPALFDSRI